MLWSTLREGIGLLEYLTLAVTVLEVHLLFNIPAPGIARNTLAEKPLRGQAVYTDTGLSITVQTMALRGWIG
jgi:hypothetical protein